MAFSGSEASKKFSNKNTRFEAKGKKFFSITGDSPEKERPFQSNTQDNNSPGKTVDATNTVNIAAFSFANDVLNDYGVPVRPEAVKTERPISNAPPTAYTSADVFSSDTVIFDQNTPVFHNPEKTEQFIYQQPEVKFDHLQDHFTQEKYASEKFQEQTSDRLFAVEKEIASLTEKETQIYAQGENVQPSSYFQQQYYPEQQIPFQEQLSEDQKPAPKNEDPVYQDYKEYSNVSESSIIDRFREKAEPVFVSNRNETFKKDKPDRLFDQAEVKEFREHKIDFIENDAKGNLEKNKQEKFEQKDVEKYVRSGKKSEERIYGRSSTLDEKALRKQDNSTNFIDKHIHSTFDADKNTYEKIIENVQEKTYSNSAPESSHFKSLNVSFQDEKTQFNDRVAEAFRKEGFDKDGNSIFTLPSAVIGSQTGAMTAAEVVGANRTKATTDKFVSDRSPDRKKFSEAGRSGDSFAEQRGFSSFKDNNTSGASEHQIEQKNRNELKKFDTTELRERDNKHLKSTDSYFKDTKTSSSSNSKNSGKSGKKENTNKEGKKKKVRSLGILAAFKRTKRNIDQYVDSVGKKKSSGDLIKDQTNSGLIGIIKERYLSLLKAIGFLFLPIIALIILVVLLILIVVSFIVITIYSFSGASLDPDYEIVVDGGVTGDGQTFTSLTDVEIDEILSQISLTYGGLTYIQEGAIRYALTKVGCPYDQDYHGNTSVDIFDCSSLVYRAYQNVGVDISYVGAYTAAYECEGLELNMSALTATSELMPGDLIFYGGSGNGRYKGIYHVAMYVGNGKMVEARGKKYGVVYGDVRSNNIVSLCRPW